MRPNVTKMALSTILLSLTCNSMLAADMKEWVSARRDMDGCVIALLDNYTNSLATYDMGNFVALTVRNGRDLSEYKLPPRISNGRFVTYYSDESLSGERHYSAYFECDGDCAIVATDGIEAPTTKFPICYTTEFSELKAALKYFGAYQGVAIKRGE